jgi:hypothetical protein
MSKTIKLDFSQEIIKAEKENLRSFSLSCTDGLDILKVAHFLNKNMRWDLHAEKTNEDFFLYHYFYKWETTDIFLLNKQLKKTPENALILMFLGNIETFPFEEIISRIEKLDFVFSVTELEETKELSEIYMYLNTLKSK